MADASMLVNNCGGSCDTTMDNSDEIMSFSGETDLSSVLPQERLVECQQVPRENPSSDIVTAPSTLADQEPTPEPNRPVSPSAYSPDKDNLMWALQSLSLESSESKQQDAEESYAQS